MMGFIDLKFTSHMATKEDRPNLLSKMASFVRNPTKDWSEIGRPEPEQENGYDKQALKAMIERRRQNDFVRRREFDNLRKLRRKDPVAIAGAARPSFFQSSLPVDADGRADTLKKIDEIEAHMSKQWWKGKQDATPASDAAQAAAGSATGTAATEVSTIGPDLGEDLFEATTLASVHHQKASATGFASTELASSLQKLPNRHAPASAYGADAEFSSSDLLAIEPDDLMTDPELEEAAIRFANADREGAQSALVDALAGLALVPEVAQTWVCALLDFYRASGQPESFDRTVREYADHLGPLTPKWFDIAGYRPTQHAVGVRGNVVPAKHQGANRPVWVCPGELTSAAMEELRVTLSQAPSPWALDWAELHEISDSALPLLSGFFGSLVAEEVALRFTGSARLVKALRDITPSGSRAGDDIAWTVRLDALRTMQLQSEFELAALDFCITFEVPPPDWQNALCTYIDGDKETGGDLQGGDSVSTTMPLGLDGMRGSAMSLSGQIAGEPGAALAQLGIDHPTGAHLVVSCRGLVCVDFAGAGSILNWAATCHSRGCQVQFLDVHRLVAAFFSVIGITEYARVTLLPID